MKLLMAVSKDGYVARERNDDMSWTGPFDKAAFRLLSHVGGELGCGSTTYDMLPQLKGRKIHRLSRAVVQPLDKGGAVCQDLHWFQANFPNGWLIGGQRIALNALALGFVDQAFLCMSDRKCFPEVEAQQYQLSCYIHDRGIEWAQVDELRIGDVRVEVWRREKKLVFPDRPVYPTTPAVFDDSQFQYMDKCGCRVGTVCCNAACPHRSIVTCHVDPSLGI